MTANDLFVAGCALVALAVPILTYHLGGRRGYERGRADAPACGHLPCPLVGVRARVEMATPVPPDRADTRSLSRADLAAAHAEAEARAVEPATSWAAGEATERYGWPVDAPSLPDPTKVRGEPGAPKKGHP